MSRQHRDTDDAWEAWHDARENMTPEQRAADDAARRLEMGIDAFQQAEFEKADAAGEVVNVGYTDEW